MGDEESAQHEEQIDADPTVEKGRDQIPVPDEKEALVLLVKRPNGMAAKDQQYRYRPQAVQFGDRACRSRKGEVRG